MSSPGDLRHALRSARQALASRDRTAADHWFARASSELARMPDAAAATSVEDILDAVHDARGLRCSAAAIPLIDEMLRKARAAHGLDRTQFDLVLLVHGLVHAEAQSPQGAVESLEELLARPGVAAVMRTSATQQLGLVYSTLDDPRAVTMLRDTLDTIIAARRGAQAEADARIALARALVTHGSIAEAEALAREAIPVLDASGDLVLSALGHDVLGRALQLKGAFDESRANFETALARVRRAAGENSATFASALGNLAALHFAEGDYASAEREVERSLSILRSVLGERDPALAAPTANLVLIRSERGDDEGAERLLQQLEAIVAANPAATGALVHALAHRARMMARRSDPQAYVWFSAGRERLGDTPAAAVFDAQLARLELERGDIDAAEARYTRLAAQHAAMGTLRTSEYGAVLLGLAKVALARGDWARAFDGAREAAAVTERALGPEYVDLPFAFLVQAFACAGLERFSEAAAMLLRAKRIEDRSFEMLADVAPHRQRAIVPRLRGTLETAVSFHVDRAQVNSELADIAFELIIQRKAVSAELAAERIAVLSASEAGPVARDALQQLRDIHRALAAQMFAMEPAADAHVRNVVAALLEQRDAVESALPPELRPSAAARTGLDRRSIARLLPAGSAYVDFVWYRSVDVARGAPSEADESGRYAAYWITANGASGVVPIGSSNAVDAAVRGIFSALADSEGERVPMEEAYRLLIAPLPPQVLGARHLFISPDGMLNAVAFAVLSPAPGVALQDRCSMSYVESARDLVPHPERSPRQGPVVVIADDVPGNHAELDALRRLFPAATFWTGREAAKSVLSEELAGPIVFHAAAHGRWLPGGESDDAMMARSFIQLADGRLSALETAFLDLHGCELATLSACDTGRGNIFTGQGIGGLRRGLRLAGARSQLLTLWPIDGHNTAIVISMFYEALSRGAPRERALHEAQCELARRGEAPYHWAGFVLYGATGPVQLAP